MRPKINIKCQKGQKGSPNWGGGRPWPFGPLDPPLRSLN